jgi:hypothetical protein
VEENWDKASNLTGTPASSTTKTGRHDIVESGVKHHIPNHDCVLWRKPLVLSARQNKAIKAQNYRTKSTQREPPTMGKQLVNFITCGCESSAPFCNLQSRARTHAALVIGLYQLLGNPTTYLIELGLWCLIA